MQFNLLPFDHLWREADIRIAVRIDPLPEAVSVHYRLTGPLQRLELPAAADVPTRKDDLWQNTCFECFIRRQGEAGYREFNFSPSGDWNIYRFTGYREGMTPEQAVARLPMKMQQDPQMFELTTVIDRVTLGLQDHPLQMAVCAVTRTRNGDVGYWAVHHPVARPDFHHPSGFAIQI